MVSRLAIIKKDLDINHCKIFNQLIKEGIKPRTEYPDFLSYSLPNITKNELKIPYNTPKFFDDLKQLLILNSEGKDIWRVDPEISKILKKYIQEQQDGIFRNLNNFIGIFPIYYYDIFDTLSKIECTFTLDNFIIVLSFIESLLDKTEGNGKKQIFGAISNFIRSLFTGKRINIVLTDKTILCIQKILLRIIQCPTFISSEHYNEYRNDPSNSLTHAINDPVGVALNA